MSNNGYAIWKPLTVFLCIVSFTSSVFCGRSAYLPVIQEAFEQTRAIEEPLDAFNVLDTLSSLDEKTAITVITQFCSSFSENSVNFKPDKMLQEDLATLNHYERSPHEDQQAKLLTATLIDPRYKEYRQTLALLETHDKYTPLMHAIDSWSHEQTRQMAPLYQKINKLNARSVDGLSPLSLTIKNALSAENTSSYDECIQTITTLLANGASTDGLMKTIQHPSEIQQSISECLEQIGFHELNGRWFYDNMNG